MKTQKYQYIQLKKEGNTFHIRKYSKSKFQIRQLNNEVTSINGIDFINFLS